MQSELKLFVIEGGNYEAGGNKASWRVRPGSNVIDLHFREKRFEITREGTGPNGRPRFLINGTRQPDGKLFQGRDILELIRKLDLFWPELIQLPARFDGFEGRVDRKLDRFEGKLDRIATAVTGNRHSRVGSKKASGRRTQAACSTAILEPRIRSDYS